MGLLDFSAFDEVVVIASSPQFAAFEIRSGDCCAKNPRPDQKSSFDARCSPPTDKKSKSPNPIAANSNPSNPAVRVTILSNVEFSRLKN
jgi:hypothetical protein